MNCSKGKQSQKPKREGGSTSTRRAKRWKLLCGAGVGPTKEGVGWLPQRAELSAAATEEEKRVLLLY